MVVGRAFKAKNYTTCTAVNSTTDIDASSPTNHEELVELVNNFWRLETIGILDNPSQQDDEQCLKHFNNTVYYDETQKRNIMRFSKTNYRGRSSSEYRPMMLQILVIICHIMELSRRTAKT
ncbi:unnamed protein product [Cylicocyclus nassatus]|uniref:Uncharacterized protein n=1 Tax=Cylicocyclus nassatus TaxID=53992 RepID=A0AA36GP40_CYLNA|nr:unnamed protein product [Cylicocyclus nassatus]